MSSILNLNTGKLELILNTCRCISGGEPGKCQCNAKGLGLPGKDDVGIAVQQRSSSVKARTEVPKSRYSNTNAVRFSLNAAV